MQEGRDFCVRRKDCNMHSCKISRLIADTLFAWSYTPEHIKLKPILKSDKLAKHLVQ